QRLEDGEAAGARPAQGRGDHARTHGPPHAGRERRDRQEMTPILVAERQVEEEIFDRAQPLRLDGQGAPRADPFHEPQGRREIEHAFPSQNSSWMPICHLRPKRRCASSCRGVPEAGSLGSSRVTLTGSYVKIRRSSEFRRLNTSKKT